MFPPTTDASLHFRSCRCHFQVRGGKKCQLSLGIIKNAFVSDCSLLPCIFGHSAICFLTNHSCPQTASLLGIFDRAPDERHIISECFAYSWIQEPDPQLDSSQSHSAGYNSAKKIAEDLHYKVPIFVWFHWNLFLWREIRGFLLWFVHNQVH